MKEKTALLFAFLVLCTLLFPTSVALTTPSSDNDAPHLIITEIYPNTATKNELDEYVAITNPCAYPVNIEGWSITDNEGTIIFPSFEVAPQQTVYVARNASAFREQLRTASRIGIIPDFEYGADSDFTVCNMQTTGRSLALRNTGDEVILRDKSGKEMDAVLFGETAYEGEGWRDEPLEKTREGMILRRIGNQDTDRCEDWLVLPFGASYHATQQFACSGVVTAFVSPDCSFPVLQRELNNASSSLYINLYEFDNPYLMDSILEVLDRGVQVRLLLDGNPVGGITAEELYIAKSIKERGGDVRLSSDPFINHAKYAVIDNETLIMTTENWKTTGFPSNNSFGNRGWGIVLKNEAVATYFTDVFFEDFYRGKEYALEEKYGDTNEFTIPRTIPQGAYVPVFEPRSVTCDFTVIPVLAPDTALSNETILGVIESAQQSIFVQQFSTGRYWADEANPFLTALIAAARRGCEVKVLFDSKGYNLEAWNDNDEAVRWLEQVANEEHLNLKAKLADLDSLGLTKVHTKGLIVDSKVVVIASLNWNANSIYNREAGVIVENAEIASFYEEVFFHDWNVSISTRGEPEGKLEEGPVASEGKSSLKMKFIGLAITLILSFVIFRIVKWYKRL